MAELKTYKTPGAFTSALGERLRSRAKADGVPTDRARSLAVMERFSARVVAVFPATTVLKGGLALQLRLDRARSTKDIDLRLLGEPAAAAAWMARAAAHQVDPDEHLTFSAMVDPEHPTIHGKGVV